MPGPESVVERLKNSEEVGSSSMTLEVEEEVLDDEEANVELPELIAEDTSLSEAVQARRERNVKAAEEAKVAEEKVALTTQEDEMSVDEAKRIHAEKKARIAQILERGVIAEKITIRDGDPNKYYVWVRTREEDIDRYRALGFEIETQAGDRIHPTGDGKRVVGDVVLMSISMEEHLIIEEVKEDRRKKRRYEAEARYKKAAAGTPFPTIEE